MLESVRIVGKYFPSGGMAERFKAPVLKTGVGKPTVGSNPSPSAQFQTPTGGS